MDTNNLKYVVGQAETGKPAIIRFFGPVDEYSTFAFNDEFLWLQECVKPSKIIVMINSEGGSVIDGMSTFSVIQNSDIETDCIIEGIAASMGSIIWAAGDHLFMHDYSLLMIHNPFCGGAVNSNDPKTQQVIKAFKTQISTIYQKRFGFSKARVKEIMDGKKDEDGTFFTAAEAVKEGIINSDRVIKTSKHVRDEIRNKIEGIEDSATLRDTMTSILNEIDENKLIEQVSSIYRKKEENNQVQDLTQMETKDNVELSVLRAQLGCDQEASASAVIARIAEIAKSDENLKKASDQINELNIKLKGKEAEVSNMKSDLDKANAALKKYQEAEEAALNAEIEATVDAAISDGKIEASAKADWMALAKTNYAQVKATLNSIQGREDILKAITEDPENKKKRIEDTVSEVAKKVEEICGKEPLKTF